MAASRARSEPRRGTRDHDEEDHGESNPFWPQRARLEFLRNRDEAEAPENSAEDELRSISSESGGNLPAIQDDDASEELLEAETLVAGAGPQTANELSATTRGMSTGGEPLAGRTTWPSMSSRWVGGLADEAQPTGRTMTPTRSGQHADEGRPTTSSMSSMVEGVSSMASRVLVEQPTTSRTMTSSRVAPGLVRPSTGSMSSNSAAPGRVRSLSGSMSSSRVAPGEVRPTSRSMTTTRSDAGGGQATAGRMSSEGHELPRGPPRSWMPGEIHPQGGQVRPQGGQVQRQVEAPMDLEREFHCAGGLQGGDQFEQAPTPPLPPPPIQMEENRAHLGADKAGDKEEDLRSIPINLPKLAEVHAENAALRAGDWLSEIRPLIADVSQRAGPWWLRLEERAMVAYQKWLSAGPLERLKVIPEKVEEEPFIRLESRVVSMLLGALPQSLKQEIISMREVTCVQILYKVLRHYQPGGVNERASTLAALRPRRQRMQRTLWKVSEGGIDTCFVHESWS